MPDPGTVRPVLDDAYWFAYSKDIVEKAVASRNEQAARFQTFIVWLWGIYTASAAVSLTLGKENLPLYAKVFIALPSLILILAYWSAVQAQTPPYVRFDPRSPTEIMAAYDEQVRQKENLLWWARAWSFVAAFLIGAALVLASLTKPAEKSTEKQVTAPEFNAEKKGALLNVWGRGVGCDKFIIAAVSETSGWATRVEKIMPCSPNGEFGAKLELNPRLNEILAKIEWTDSKGISHTMARQIK